MHPSHPVARCLLAGLLAAAPARAADLGPDGLVTLLPPGPVVGGGPEVELYVVALEPDGAPVLGAKLKALRTVGMDRRWTEVGGGVYLLRFRPPPVVAPSAIDVTVRGKSRATRTRLTLDQAIELRPPPAPVAAEANLPSLRLGRDPETTITVTGTSEAGTRVRASAGTIGDIDVLPGGGAAIRFEPPAVQYPHAAVVTFADAARPFDRRGHLVLKLVGNASYPVKAPPGAQVHLEVGGKRFGPVTADASGTAKVPVEVEPGILEGTQITVADGKETRAPVDLKIPETRRIGLFPLPPDLPADPAVTVPLRAVVVDRAGNPDPAAPVAFDVPGGALGPVTHLGDGVYEAIWTLPDAPGTGTVRVGLGSEVQSDAIDLTFLHPRAASVLVTPEVPEIAPDTEQVPVVARLADAAGRPIAGATLAVEVEGATLVGGVEDRGNGDYGFVLDPADEGEVVARVVVTSGTSRSPAAAVVVAPRATQVATGDEGGTEVVVATIDAVGLPVPNAVVKLSAEGGEGTVEPAEVTTGDDGTAIVRFLAGAEAGATRLAAVSGSASGAAVVMGAPGDLAPVAIPAAATARGGATLPGGIAAASFLGAGLPLGIPRAALPPPQVADAGSATGADDGVADAASGTGTEEPEAPVPAEPVPAEAAPSEPEAAGTDAPADASPPPAVEPPSITVTAEPASVAPGETLTVTAARVGGTGEPPAAEGTEPAEAAAGTAAPELAVTGGVVESVTTGEDGVVTAVVRVAADANAPVQIVATAGDLSRTLEVALDLPADPWASPAPETIAAAPIATGPAAAAPAGPPPAAATESPPPAPGGGTFRWLRARVMGLASTYRYEQSPTDIPGPLLPQRLGVGGPNGGKPATPWGGEVAARAWGDPLGVPAVGVAGQVRIAPYSITAAQFSQPARDALTNIELSVIGRYPLDVAGDRYWAGAKAGFLYGDFMLFTGCLEPQCTIEFLPVPVPGLGLGAEVGADVGPLSVIAGYTHGLARGVEPYASLFDLDGGFEVADHLTANLGLSVTSRKVGLQGERSGVLRGSLTDAQMMVRVGVGLAL